VDSTKLESQVRSESRSKTSLNSQLTPSKYCTVFWIYKPTPLKITLFDYHAIIIIIIIITTIINISTFMINISTR